MKHPLRIQVDLRSDVPGYQQIVNRLRTYLVEGELEPGDVLPSVRRLAIDLSMHFNSVAQAYRALAEEGWVELRQGRRVTVVDRKPVQTARRRHGLNSRQRLRELIAQLRADGAPAASLAAELRILAESLDR